MSKDYKELVERIADELWEDLSYTPLDFDNREDCAKNIISIISKDVINKILKDLDECYSKITSVGRDVKMFKLLQKYEKMLKNVEEL